MISKNPEQIGNKEGKFYIVFEKFASSNASLMLMKNTNDRDELKKWISEEERNKLSKLENEIEEIEQEIKELHMEKEIKGISGSEKYSADIANQNQTKKLKLKRFNQELIEKKRKARGDISISGKP